MRVLDGDRHWRLSREGTIEPVSAQTVAMDRRFLAGHVYRTLHRIAARDPAQPYLYGPHDDEVGTIFGPWEHERSGIRHPVWVSRDGGKWRAMLKQLEVNVALDDAIFSPP